MEGGGVLLAYILFASFRLKYSIKDGCHRLYGVNSRGTYMGLVGKNAKINAIQNGNG